MPCDRDDDQLPCIETLIAATVSLMTCWADPAASPRADSSVQRRLLAKKIVSNLFFLRHHPDASPALRLVMGNAHAHWVALLQGAGDADELVCRADTGARGVVH